MDVHNVFNQQTKYIKPNSWIMMNYQPIGFQCLRLNDEHNQSQYFVHDCRSFDSTGVPALERYSHETKLYQ